VVSVSGGEGADAGTGAAGVAITETTLGPALVDAAGRTLYGFLNDTPDSSACDDACAAAWPPVSGDTALPPDVDPDLFSVIDRPDGTTQLVIGNWPLYRFAGDAGPGDINGQGSGDVWFVIAPDGSLYR
jgi:predicted lipoprotein with Yx(FWY)xxD motif